MFKQKRNLSPNNSLYKNNRLVKTTDITDDSVNNNNNNNNNNSIRLNMLRASSEKTLKPNRFSNSSLNRTQSHQHKQLNQNRNV